MHGFQVHVPTLNHVGLWVDDLEACVAFLHAEGVRFTPGGSRKGAAGHNVTFLHPKASGAQHDSAPRRVNAAPPLLP